MKIHRLYQEQILNIAVEEAWEFFSNPRNLDKITPEDMQFRITSEPIPKLFEGQIITYRIRLAPMIWRNWVTEIKAVEPGRSFIDEQRFGPYKFWSHRHELAAVDEKNTQVTDEIHYAIGFGPFGEWARALFVERKLNAIFEYRRKALEERFNRQDLAPSGMKT